MKQLSIKTLVISSLGICLVFASTFLIKIPNGFHGYFNAGDGILFAFATIVNPFFAFCIGGIGSCFADIIGGYASYALFTLCIKGIEAMIVSYVYNHFKKRLPSLILASLWMIFGYWLVDAFINQSFWLATLAVPINIMQALVGIGIASLLIPILHKYLKEE